MSLEINKISKFYGQQRALDKVTFSLKKGELAGFLGPNGAGKSTLMKIITGYLPASEGEIRANGIQVNPDNLDVKRMTGYLPENNPLYTDLYVRESLEIMAGFHRLPKPESRIREMIGLTGLEKEQHKKIGALSKGYRQRVGLAQALLHDPSILILDEPTSGLDPNQLNDIRALISGLSREKTVLLSSHILQEIEALCHRVIIISNGRLVADSTLQNLKEGKISQSQQVFVEFDREISATDLLQISGVAEVALLSKGWLVSGNAETDLRQALFRYAVSADLTLLALTERQQNLETIFQQLTTGLPEANP